MAIFYSTPTSIFYSFPTHPRLPRPCAGSLYQYHQNNHAVFCFLTTGRNAAPAAPKQSVGAMPSCAVRRGAAGSRPERVTQHGRARPHWVRRSSPSCVWVGGWRQRIKTMPLTSSICCEKVSSIPKYGHYHASRRHGWEDYASSENSDPPNPLPYPNPTTP